MNTNGFSKGNKMKASKKSTFKFKILCTLATIEKKLHGKHYAQHCAKARKNAKKGGK